MSRGGKIKTIKDNKKFDMEKLIIYRRRTPYELFIEQMERIGLKRVPFNLQEKDIDISEEDTAIYIEAKDCQSISIRGIAESRIKGKLYLEPHRFHLRIFGDSGNEVNQEDTIQFSITEFKKAGFSAKEKNHRTVYYSYPYKMAISGLKIKKGMIISKDRRLEIRIIRNGEPIKIGKIEIDIECDKWLRIK